ncbi:hypothetical protein [Komagataeibacter sp. NFXK3]
MNGHEQVKQYGKCRNNLSFPLWHCGGQCRQPAGWGNFYATSLAAAADNARTPWAAGGLMKVGRILQEMSLYLKKTTSANFCS